MSTIVFPGQGAQHKGMGEELFEEFSEHCAVADQILGYSIRDLCLIDKDNCLNLTQFTQPALYTVNALHCFKYLKSHSQPMVLAGHSLGEYNALLAAGVFDFETGLKLVHKRGELMSRARDGGMLAIIRTNQNQVESILSSHQLNSIDIANYNSPSQLVLSGQASDIKKAKEIFVSEKVFCIPLKVSGAFHSRYMKEAAKGYQNFLEGFEFSPLKIPVIANVTGELYKSDQVKELLVKQLCGSVQWTNTIRYLMAIKETDITEVGPGQVLTKLNAEIIEKSKPIQLVAKPSKKSETITSEPKDKFELGSQSFLKHHQIKYPYVAGSMCQGISSDKLVIKMAQSGFLAFIGSYGLSLDEVEKLIESCARALGSQQNYGVNIHNQSVDLDKQRAMWELCIKYHVPCVEVSGFDHISLSLILYRIKGLSRAADQIAIKHKIFLKTTRLDTAALFMQPAPLHLLDKLLAERQITPDEHLMAQSVSVADDICVEGDGGWKTDQVSALVKLPEVMRLRDQQSQLLNSPVRVGCSGGIGTPEAVAAVFMLGADFILTGSINQCTVESNTSDHTKQLLSKINSEDTCYVPAGDLFESGARAQVVRKGFYFPARAQKLYDLYRVHSDIDDLSVQDIKQIEKHFFARSMTSVYQEIIATKDNHAIKKMNESKKYKMAEIFKWYFDYAQKLSMQGVKQEQDNYQIYCGPALGAFNQWAAGTAFESWQNRQVDKIALSLLEDASAFLKSKLEAA